MMLYAQQTPYLKRVLVLLAVFTLSPLLTGCGSEADEGVAAPDSTAPSPSLPTIPTKALSERAVERLTLTAFPYKIRGTSKLTVIKGNDQHFVALGENALGRSRLLSEDDSSTITWYSSDNTVAEFIQPGVLRGKSSGQVTVSISKDNLTSNSLEVTVSDAVITDILVTPSSVKVAKGYHEPLTAIATYSNGLSSNISDSVTWTSNDTSKATMTSKNNYGLLTGGNVGPTTVTAVKDGVTSNTVNVNVTDAVLTAISVTPTTLNVAKGQQEPLTAMAIYNDGTSSNISDLVNWSVDTSNATVTDNGVLSGSEVGDATVTATENGVTSNAVSVKVSDAVLKSLLVTPTTVAIVKGQNQALKAEATYSDGKIHDVSKSVIWAPIGNKAMITPDGLLSGVDVGNTTLTAFKDGITSNTIDVEVSDALLTSISVTPKTVSVAKGQTERLTAMATYSNGTSLNISDSVTWNPVDATTATVTPEGLLSGENVSTTTLTAFKDGVTSNTVDVDVTNAVMTGLTLNPPAVGLMLNGIQPMKATAVYSDGTSSDVSDSVTWLAPVGDDTMSVTADGSVKGLNEGSAIITAYHNGFNHSVDVNVCSGDGDVTGKCIYTDDYHGDANFTFITSPSIAYLDSLGLGGTHTSGTDGLFYTFTHPKATALCTQYNNLNLFGRDNWRLPTLNEMKHVYNFNFPARNWDISRKLTWTSTAEGSLRFAYQLINSRTHGWYKDPTDYKHFASCISKF